MKKSILIINLAFAAMILTAQNPISPAGFYIADPTARVWNDGRLYIYGSADESCEYYCSQRYHVLFTENMFHWEIAENSFASSGLDDEVKYNDNLLFAPSAAYSNRKYFLYYCQPDREFAQGVAASTSPTGPFANGKPMNVGGYNQIDPGIFIDDDGTAWYFWGQFTLKMAWLNPDMQSIDEETIRDSVLTESNHHFHEGAFMTKINGLYYLVFADISRGDIPTCLGYATAKSPYGPYTYRGVIIDNNHCNPGNWNNHGSIAQFYGQWYVFYHRSTHGCNKMRKACAEPINILPDGSIPEVEMTSQGAGGPLLATKKIEAEWACILNGNLRIEDYETGKGALAKIFNEDKAAFKYVNFGSGADSVSIKIKNGGKGGKMVVSLDKPWHQRAAILEIPPSSGISWEILTYPIENISGIHALWLHFYGEYDQMFDLDWLVFHSSSK
jgi:arabinoxylan arabinofuranohydrolase